MRKILIILFVFLAGIITPLNAETEIRISIERENLVIEKAEVKERKEIPNVPSGIIPEAAYQLVTGELKEIVKVEEEEKKEKFLFSFPAIVIQVTRENKIVTYDEGGWKEKKGTPSIEKIEEQVVSFFVFGLLPIYILSLGFLCQCQGGYKRLMVFYIGIFFSAVAGVFAGMLVGVLVGMSVGIFAGGLYTVVFVEKLAGILEIFARMLAGVLAGALAGTFAEGGWYGYENFSYLMFVAAVEVVSFVIAYICKR